MSNVKQQILAEIERRIEWLNTATTDFAEGRRAELRSLYDFINALPDEPVSEDLEEAAENPDVLNNVSHAAFEYERTRNDLDALSNNEVVRRAFKAVAEWQKRKMLEGAVEGEAHVLPGHYAYVKEKYNRSLEQYILDNFKTGDDVAIIILPKEK